MDNVNYENLKAEYADAQLRAYNWHLNRLKYWQDKIYDLDAWASQGFTHGKDYGEEHVPQKHYRGDFTEQKILDYSEQLEEYEQKVNEEQKIIDTIDQWLATLDQDKRWIIKDYYFNRKPYETIAQLYGVSRNTIRTYINLALLTFPEN